MLEKFIQKQMKGDWKVKEDDHAEIFLVSDLQISHQVDSFGSQ